MLLLPCSRGRAGAWIVKRAASTYYRPGVRPFDQTRRGARFRRSSKTFHKPRNARLDDLITEAQPTYDPYSRAVVMDSGLRPSAGPGMTAERSENISDLSEPARGCLTPLCLLKRNLQS